MGFRIFDCTERSTFEVESGQHGRFAQTTNRLPKDLQRPQAHHTASANQTTHLHLSQRALSGPAVLGAGARGASRRSLVEVPCRVNMLP